MELEDIAPSPQRHGQTIATAFGLFIVGVIVFTFIQIRTSGLIGNDSYYHLKMAALMLQQGPLLDFVWLPQTTLNPKTFYNHQLLYHLYLAGFIILIPDLFTAAKVATVFFGALLPVTVWWLLRRQFVPFAPLWALLLFGLSSSFLIRMSQVRTPVVALLLLIMGFHSLLHRRYWLVGVLGFVFAWTYNGVLLLIAVGAAVALGAAISERRFEWQAMMFPMVGVLLGFVINPYFPLSITQTLLHISPKLTLAARSPLLGAEWAPATLMFLFQLNRGVLLLILLGTMLFATAVKSARRESLAAVFLAVGFTLLTLRSLRFVEYWPAFVLIAVAMVSSSQLRRVMFDGGFQSYILLEAVMVFCVVVSGSVMVSAARQIASIDVLRYQNAAEWLETNSDAGTMVYLANWGNFPQFFYFNTHNVYSAGLDPTFTQQYDGHLHDAYVSLTRGDEQEVGRTINDLYAADLIFVPQTPVFGALREQAKRDPTLHVVYQDQYGLVYRYQPPIPIEVP